MCDRKGGGLCYDPGSWPPLPIPNMRFLSEASGERHYASGAAARFKRLAIRSNDFTGRRRFAVTAALVLTLFLILTIVTAVTKAPWCDEGWFASPAYNLAFKGFMGTTVLDPGSGTPVLHTRTRVDGIDRYTYWVMPLSLIAQAGWFKLLGFGLLRMRALSMVWALLALFAWWIVFHQLSGKRYVALLAVALMEVDYEFVWSAADGRMDMMCAALGATGLAAYLLLRERSLPWAMVAANACIAASGLTHPNGILYLVALGCILMMFDRRRIGWRHLALSGVPYLVALALWLPYVMKAPDLFRIQLLGNTAGRDTAFAAPILSLEREAERYLHAFGFAPWSHGLAHSSILELLAYLSGVAACAFQPQLRHKPAARRAVILTSAICLFLFLFEGAKVSQYLVHVIPWFSFALAVAVMDWWVQRRMPRIIPVAITGVVMFLAIVRLAVPALRDNYRYRYVPAARFLEGRAAPTDLIMGSAELIFALGTDRPVLDDIMLGTTTGKTARFIVMDPRYSDYLESIRATAPADYERVAQRLREHYQKIYDEADWQIYRLVG